MRSPSRANPHMRRHRPRIKIPISHGINRDARADPNRCCRQPLRTAPVTTHPAAWPEPPPNRHSIPSSFDTVRAASVFFPGPPSPRARLSAAAGIPCAVRRDGSEPRAQASGLLSIVANPALALGARINRSARSHQVSRTARQPFGRATTAESTMATYCSETACRRQGGFGPVSAGKVRPHRERLT